MPHAPYTSSGALAASMRGFFLPSASSFSRLVSGNTSENCAEGGAVVDVRDTRGRRGCGRSSAGAEMGASLRRDAHHGDL